MRFLTWRRALQIAGILSIGVSIVWLVREPGFNSILALLAGLATLASSLAASERPIESRPPARSAWNAPRTRRREPEYEDEWSWATRGSGLRKILLAPLAVIGTVLTVAFEALFGILPVIILVVLAALPLSPLWAPAVSRAITGLTAAGAPPETESGESAAVYSVTFRYNDLQQMLELPNYSGLEIRLALDDGRTVAFDARGEHVARLSRGQHKWDAVEIFVLPSGERGEMVFSAKGSGTVDVRSDGTFWFERAESWWGDQVLVLKSGE